jgi:hypothetical protein
MCNVTLRRFRRLFLPWKNNKYYIFMCVFARVCGHAHVCSLAYPACNENAPYCEVMWPLGLHRIFRHYFINGTSFEKKVIKLEICFDFLYNICLKHFSF